MKGFVRFSQRIIWMLFLCIIAYLLIASVFSTCYFGTIQYSTMSGEIERNQQHTFYLKDNYLVHIFLWMIFSAFLFVFKGVKNKKWKRMISWSAICLSALAALYIVLAGQYYPRADQWYVIDAAAGFLQGDYSALEPNGHVFLWPHEIGIVLFYCMLSFIFGSWNIVAFQTVNIVLILISYVLLAKIGKLLFGGEIETGILVVTVLFVPYLFYSTFLYGNVIGFMLASLACFCVISFTREWKWYYLVVGAISMALAIIMKPNCQIFLIALVIYLLGSLIANRNGDRKKSGGIFLYLVMLIGSYWAGKWGMGQLLIHLSGGKEITGVPMLALVAMGLQDCKSAPGWWSGYTYNIFLENQFDYEATVQVAKEEIIRIVRTYPKDIAAAVSFFVKKIASQWNNPTYHSLWIISYREGRAGLDWLWNESVPRSIYINFVNLVQTWILTGSFFYALFRRKTDRWDETLLPLIFIGGFVFHIFWEAQNMYAVPYILILFPLCVSGYREWRHFLLNYKAHRKSLLTAAVCLLLICMVSRTEVFAKTFARIDDEGIFDPYTQNVVDQDKLVGIDEN